MTKRAIAWSAGLCALLPFGAVGCVGSEDSSQPSSSEIYSVALMASTRSSLPSCTSSRVGTVAYVTSPPSLYACENGSSWTQITCTAATSGSVAYADFSPPMLLSCINRTWTPIPLPQGEAGPAGPRGPAGPPGEAGAAATITATQLPAGDPDCAAGGVEIHITSNGVVQPPVYVCNGIGIDASIALDASDASDAMTIPPGLLAYPGEYATAFCTGIANCCGLDAGGFDFPTCEGDWSISGYRGLPTILPSPAVTNRGNLTFNATQAASCVAAVQAWPCGTFTAADNAAIISACLDVLGGTIPIGGTGCQSSFECVSGAYCNAAGTCSALVTQGGTCTLDEQCTYVGTLQPELACDLYPSDGGSPTTGTCQPPKASGASSKCFNANTISDLMCSSRLCDDTVSSCGNTATNPWPPICANYVIPPG